MDELRSVLDQVIDGGATQRASAEVLEMRTKLISGLFAVYAEELGTRVDQYVFVTEEIPLHFLAVAIRGLLRSHHWNRVPLPADIWSAARYAAGMHREQYHAGKYLPPPREWPPQGKRYAVTAGEFEPLAPAIAIGPGEIMAQLGAGEH